MDEATGLRQERKRLLGESRQLLDRAETQAAI